MSTTTADGRVRMFWDGAALTAGVAKSKDALSKMDEVLRRTGPALGDMSKASKAAGLGVDLLSGGILGAVKTMGPWGLAIGVGADALIGLVASSEAAEKASRAFAKAQEDERKAVLEAADAIARKTFWEKELERDLRRASATTTPRIREIEEEIAATRGWGESTAELTRELSKLTAAELRQQKAHRAGLETLAENEARAKDLERQAQEIERKQRLADIEEEAAREKRMATKVSVGGKSGAGAGKTKEKPVDFDFAGRAEFEAELALAKQAQAEKKAMREQDEIDFKTYDERFDLIQKQKADALEEARDKAHDAEMERLREEKEAKEEKAAADQRMIDAAAGYAGQAVAGLLSISDARKQARAAALAQGKSEAEAARAAKAAELQARAAAMIGIRNMAATKAAEHLALGIGALATTWGIPNPSAALHFAASGMFGILAGASAARAQTLGDRAAGMEGGGGFGGAGFGQPSAGAAGSGAANGPPQPAGAGNQIPGSPVPQPTQQSQSSSGGTVVHIHGNVIGNRQFVDDLARQLDEREHRRPRRAMGGG